MYGFTLCVVIDFWVCVCCYVFFFKQKTAYEMRISDWSSDVCSSDLLDHRFVWWYEESLAGAGELDFEALVLGARGRRGRKIFSVNAATAPTELIGGA